MDLKPLPIEEPSQTPANPDAKQQTTGKSVVVRNRKLKRRVNQNTQPETSSNNSQKVLKTTCQKILGYLETKAQPSLEKINQLEHILHRAILALHQEKRKQTEKKKK